MNPLILIPARMAATRLPGKPLADIGGVPMIVRVLRQGLEAGIGPVAVAAGDPEIVEAVQKAGGTAVLTDPDLPSGSDRILAALAQLDPGFAHDVVINLQGDMPFVDHHLAPIGGGFETDYVAVAERFLHAPYQWGGRESLGLDCSALVQQALYACGRACPRDTDLQRDFFPEIAEAERRRGDLVFWKGHVAILLDPDTILHANAHHMATAIEPLAEAVARIAATPTGGVLGYRRV